MNTDTPLSQDEIREELQLPHILIDLDENWSTQSEWDTSQPSEIDLSDTTSSFIQHILNYYQPIPSTPPIRLKISYYHNLLCCICYNDSPLKTICSFDDVPVKINDVDLHKLYNHRLDESFVLLGPCGEHSTCVSCLRHLSLDFTNHMINENFSYIRCCNPSDCLTPSGIPTFFEHSQIKKILSFDEFHSYSSHSEIFEFPGYHTKRCPLCSTPNIIPNDKIKNTPRDNLIVECAQNCHKLFCFYCNQRIDGIQNKHCQSCTNSSLLTDPNRLNYYFYKPLHLREKPDDILLKNSQLSPDIVLSQLSELVNPDNDVCVKCPHCLSKLFKTEQCNTLDHCKIEICYSCGKIGEKLYSWKLGDHWSETGINGCPRWDSATYWNDVAHCNFLCKDRQCYDFDKGDCSIPEHQQGVSNLKHERLKNIIYHKLKSLLSPLRNQLLVFLLDYPHLLDYIPPPSVFTQLENDVSLYYFYSPKVWQTYLPPIPEENENDT